LLRFRGLAFARWDDGRTFFGCPDTREELKASSLPALKNLLQQLENYRHPLATETRHALIARNRSAGSKPSFARMSPASMLLWIRALFIHRFSRTPAASMAFSISSP
jgi:hypothetical protein